MTTIKSIKNFSETAVIIDDGFLPPKLEMITDEDWARLRQSHDAEAWAKISSDFGNLKTPSELKRDSTALAAAWDVYQGDIAAYSLLDPIFSSVFSSQKTNILPLIPVIDFLENEMNMTVLRHPDIVSAKDDISKCKLIFLDFYLYQAAPEKIVEGIKEFGALFSDPVVHDDREHGRFVFLISTALPDKSILEKFRTITRLKTAFFKPVDKKLLNKEWLLKELGDRVARYEDMLKLTKYLDVFSNQIDSVSTSLIGEIESLELFDLAVVDSMRLQKETEHLGEYLTWLFSESLAAKIRSSLPLKSAAESVSKIPVSPFHGALAPKPVLFDLYSDIAFSRSEPIQKNNKTQFGDVYSLVSDDAGLYSFGRVAQPSSNFISNEITKPQYLVESDGKKFGKVNFNLAKDAKPQTLASSQLHAQLLLVISPACDLQRCPLDYEVTCVKGNIVKRAPTLADLFGQKSVFGIDETQPVLKHLMREKSGGVNYYSLVEWNPKQVTTITLSELRNVRKYFRLAKLNELFTHEVKEEALRRLGRVGVPVDPSFAAPLGAALRIKYSKNDVRDYLAPEKTFVSGIFLSGNEQNQGRITLSEEFIAWVDEKHGSIISNGGQIPEKVSAAITKLREDGGKGFKLNSKNNEYAFDGGFKICYRSDYESIADKNQIPNLDYAVVFYPLLAKNDANGVNID